MLLPELTVLLFPSLSFFWGMEQGSAPRRAPVCVWRTAITFRLSLSLSLSLPPSLYRLLAASMTSRTELVGVKRVLGGG